MRSTTSLFASVTLALLSVVLASPLHHAQAPLSSGSSSARHDHPVPITLGVMSKCPDALACEAVFDRVLQIVGHDKVDLSLEFISTPSDLEDAGAACKHGPSECHGNIQQLCTIAHTPSTPTSSQWWWPFLTCLDAAGKDNIGSDELARDCAEVTAIDWVGSGIEECVNGEEGRELLRKSGERVRALGIEKSCTMIINNRVRCIKDGEWQPCEGGHEPADFVRTINEEYARLNPGIAH